MMNATGSSLFRRLMTGFACVLLTVALAGLAYVFYEAKATQRTRTAAENAAHAREVLLHMADIASEPSKMVASAAALETVRARMFTELDYHSRVRLRLWKDGALLYNSSPGLPDILPLAGKPAAGEGNTWVSTVERDERAGIVVERSHEVDDEWMLSMSGVTFLLSSTIFSLPLLLLPAWLIVGIGLRPLRSIAAYIEQRDEFDLTPLRDSKYRELAPLVLAINRLLVRLRQRIEREHEFITDAAHELKTPLAAIKINAHVLMTRSDPAVRLRCLDAVDGLNEAVGRASHMVHQLLALERASTEAGGAVPEPMELGSFIGERMAAVAPMAMERGIEIELEVASSCILPLQVESTGALFDNLISNAIKYSPDGGTVWVRLAMAAEGAQLTVTDEGPGIDPALREKVFERFYRVPGQPQLGSGLGLAIAQCSALRNNARILLGAGPEGRGLVVTVQFAPGAD